MLSTLALYFSLKYSFKFGVGGYNKIKQPPRILTTITVLHGLVLLVAQSTMPLYRLLCIAVHSGEYVRNIFRMLAANFHSLNQNSIGPHKRSRIPLSITHHDRRRCRSQDHFTWHTRPASAHEKTRTLPFSWRVSGRSFHRPSVGKIFISYWTLHFDTGPRTVHSLNGLMRRDPRVIRWTTVKLADRPEELAKVHEKTMQDVAG